MPQEPLLEPRPSVLIVDDDIQVLSALATLLSEHYDVCVARAGKEALTLARRAPPDVVLLDIEMPEMDGYEVCQHLKADPLTAEIPIVFLTSHSDEATELHGLTVGGADFLSKPPRGEIVRARLANLIRMKRAAERIRAEALVDSLTGLANRGMFDRQLRTEWRRARRHQHPLSLLLIDVDSFKAYNDHYGHLAGDDALRQIAGLLHQCARRPGEIAARYGGEEFVLLLPQVDAWSAQNVARAVREALHAAALPHAASPHAAVLTASIGVATVTGEQLFVHRGEDDTASVEAGSLRLLHNADTALYAAKQAGRDQAWLLAYDSDTPTPALPPP